MTSIIKPYYYALAFLLLPASMAFAQEAAPEVHAAHPSAKEYIISEQTLSQVNAGLMETPMKYSYPVMMALQKGLKPSAETPKPAAE